jgi:hypothetical protein
MPETLEPLPTSLRALVDAEKASPDPQADVADEVFSRLTATLGLAAATAATAQAAASTSALPPPRLSLLGRMPYRTLATFLVGATVGAAGYATVSHVRTPSRQVLPLTAAPPPALPLPAPQVIETPLPAALATASRAPHDVPSGTGPALSHGRDDRLAAERNLIEMARTSLARGRFDGAWASLRRHARQFPHGQLSEERDSLLVQALVMKGDYSQALERAAEFRRRYPSSLFAPAIAQALQSIP